MVERISYRNYLFHKFQQYKLSEIEVALFISEQNGYYFMNVFSLDFLYI